MQIVPVFICNIFWYNQTIFVCMLFSHMLIYNIYEEMNLSYFLYFQGLNFAFTHLSAEDEKSKKYYEKYASM